MDELLEGARSDPAFQSRLRVMALLVEVHVPKSWRIHWNSIEFLHGGFPKWGYLQITHFNRVFMDFPLETIHFGDIPHLWNPPYAYVSEWLQV